MKPEDEFILGLIPLFRKYLTDRQIRSVDQELKKIEEKLKQVAENHDSEGDEDPVSDEEVSDEVPEGECHVELLFWDLKEDIQEFIANQLGFDSVEELINERRDLDCEPICSFAL